MGSAARIRHLGPTAAFGGPVFVADVDRGPEHYRVLGSFGQAGASGGAYTRLIEQSAMDLIVPGRLVSQHEKLMGLAFAFCERPTTALLLGIGGVSMWRFIRSYLPECATTLVDNDADIISIARRWFHLDRPVSIADGERFLADTTATFDAILVDLHGADGPVPLSEGFWTHCLAALAPGGCLATNWADLDSGWTRPMAEAQSAEARRLGHNPFFITHGRDGHVVQYVATAEGRGADMVPSALSRFVEVRNLPTDMRTTLDGCTISHAFPATT